MDLATWITCDLIGLALPVIAFFIERIYVCCGRRGNASHATKPESIPAGMPGN